MDAFRLQSASKFTSQNSYQKKKKKKKKKNLKNTKLQNQIKKILVDLQISVVCIQLKQGKTEERTKV